MKIIAAPNAFKESLSGSEAAEAIKEGVLKACPGCEVICIPVADGGDGLAEIITEALGGKEHEVVVHGPLMEKRSASFGYVEQSRVAIVEMACASGLALLANKQKDPTKTTTYGTGELILAALDKGATRIIIGLGGSATCDGGIGMASALGYRFLDDKGNDVQPVGNSLLSIHSIDTSQVDPRIHNTRFEGVCDVSNVLTGRSGASYVYSPQKGADSEQVKVLDEGLVNLAKVIQHQLGLAVDDLVGGGAAGGLGAGLYCFLNAQLQKGIDLVMDLIKLEDTLQDAELVITGEGQIDYQTKFNKAPAGVARLAKRHNIPCIAVCGSIGDRIEELYDVGFTSVFSICSGPMSLDSAMNKSYGLLVAQVEQVARVFLQARSLSENSNFVQNRRVFTK